MHRVFPTQPVEIRPERIVLVQFGVGDVEVRQRERGCMFARGRKMLIAGEIDCSVHLISPGGFRRGTTRRARFGPNYTLLRPVGQGPSSPHHGGI
jgi:hypothetical protein